MGIDRFLPEADVSECHQIEVRAPAALVFDVAENFDLQSILIVRAIFWARGMLLGSRDRGGLGPRGLRAETTVLGWSVLSRDPGRELVMGAVTQPWLADVTFRPVAPDRFASFSPPDAVKIAWTIETEPVAPARTIARTQTRALATDEAARRKFRRYWRWARAGIVLIRWLVLPAIRREAESRHRAAAHTR